MTSTMKMRIDLRVVIYPEDRWWIAHCLEMDIAAEGDTPVRAFQSLVSLCELQLGVAIEEGDLEAALQPAPSNIWKMFMLARDKRIRRRPPKQVRRFEVRELTPV